MKTHKGMEKAARRTAPGKGETCGKVYLGFWTAPAAKNALQTHARIEHKSASALMDEILCDWLCGGKKRRRP